MKEARGYDTVAELEAAETNGFVVVGISENPRARPVVLGPFASREEAQPKQDILRRQLQRADKEAGESWKIRVYVRHLWKPEVDW